MIFPCLLPLSVFPRTNIILQTSRKINFPDFRRTSECEFAPVQAQVHKLLCRAWEKMVQEHCVFSVPQQGRRFACSRFPPGFYLLPVNPNSDTSIFAAFFFGQVPQRKRIPRKDLYGGTDVPGHHIYVRPTSNRAKTTGIEA